MEMCAGPDACSESSSGSPSGPIWEMRREQERRLDVARDRWRLTRRQLEVLRALSSGLPNKLVADVLGCAQRTVEVHVGELLRRSTSGNRTELVARFWSQL